MSLPKNDLHAEQRLTESIAHHNKKRRNFFPSGAGVKGVCVFVCDSP